MKKVHENVWGNRGTHQRQLAAFDPAVDSQQSVVVRLEETTAEPEDKVVHKMIQILKGHLF